MSLDTLKTNQDLLDCEFTPEQAQVVTKLLVDRDEDLATKEDIAHHSATTTHKIDQIQHDVDQVQGNVDQLRKDVEREFGQVRTEMETGFAQARGDLEREIGQVRTEMESGFAQARGDLEREIGQVRTEMESGFAQVRADMERDLDQLRTEMETGFAHMGERFGRELAHLSELFSRELAHAITEANRHTDARFDESRLLTERVERRVLLAAVGIGGVIIAAVGLISALT